MLRLDLGSGPNPREGFEGVDIVPYQDVKWAPVDLDPATARLGQGWGQDSPWPWQPDTVEEVFCSHLVEHIRDLVGFMRECWRVCKDGALVTIHHPYQFNVRAWQDPTHVRAINEVSWFYFDRKWRTGNESALADLSVYGGCDFALEELDAIPEGNWQEIANDFPEEFERAARNQINVVSDLHVVLRCRK